MELSVQLRSGSPVPVVAVGGELDVESGLYLAGWLRWLLQARGPVLALDLAGVGSSTVPGWVRWWPASGRPGKTADSCS